MVHPIRQRRRSQETLPYGFVHDWQVRFYRIAQTLRQVWRLEISMLMTRCSNLRGRKTRRKTSRVKGLLSIGPPPAQRRAAEMADGRDIEDLDRRCGQSGLQRSSSGRVHVSLD